MCLCAYESALNLPLSMFPFVSNYEANLPFVSTTNPLLSMLGLHGPLRGRKDDDVL